MLSWLFGGKKKQSSQLPTDRFTREMEQTIRDAAPLNAEIAEQLAKQFGPGFTARAVTARAVRMGIEYIRRDQAASKDLDYKPDGHSRMAQHQRTATGNAGDAATLKSAAVTLAVYCSNLRYDDPEGGRGWPGAFRKAREEWIKSRNDTKSPHYQQACKLLSDWFEIEFEPAHASISLSYAVTGAGETLQKGTKQLRPEEAVRYAFSKPPRRKDVQVVAVDYRKNPSSATLQDDDELVHSPDVAVLAMFEATLNKEKLGSSSKLAKWIDLNADLVRSSFSISIKPEVLERTEIDEDGDEVTLSGGSWYGGDPVIKVNDGATVPEFERRMRKTILAERTEASGEESATEAPEKASIFLARTDHLREQLQEGLDVNGVVEGEPLLKWALIALVAADTMYDQGDYSAELNSRFTSAAEYRSALSDLVLLLLDAGADVNQPAGKHSILTVAEVLNDPQITPMIRARAGDSKNEEMSLLIAAERGDVERLAQALEDGIDVNTGFFNGTTALMLASQGPGGEDGPPLDDVQRVRQEAAVKFLLERGADVNAVGNDGNTAVGNAVRRNNKSIVKLLLDAGAKTTGALPFGQSLTDLARETNSKDR